ncbi:MAG: hypothetical protein U0270_34370 [Labilithrix sp.]
MIPFADLYAAQPPKPECKEVASDDQDEWELDERGCRKKKEKKKPWERGSIFGVRLSALNTDGAEKNGTFIGAMLAASSEQFHVSRIYSGHYASYGYLGGGSAGFEGGLGGTLMLGARAPFGDKYGPLARIGTSMEMQGNKRFYYSRLVLPMAEVGYQYAPNDFTVLEVGGRGGAVITGRYNTGHRTRRELGGGSLEWGFYGAAHTKITRFDISYTRIQADDNYPGGAVGTLRGTGCGYFGRLGICGDAMVVNGDGYIGLPRVPFDVTTIYAGLTVGVIDL